MPPSSWRRALPRLGLDESVNLPVRKLAAMLAVAGDRPAAAAAYREHLEGAPADLDALEKLAAILARLGRADEELAVHRRIASIVSDKLGVAPEHQDAVIAFEMASHGAADAPAAAPGAYVAASFDAIADTFDEELRDALRYRGPEQILERVVRAYGGAEATLAICDAGCGTGLCGPLLRPFARTLTGVDLSARMLEKARERGVYDELAESDLTAYLTARPRGFDIITAADVFVYIGDLTPVLAAIAGALREGGRFFCSVERADNGEYTLRNNGRYAHSAAFVRAAAAAAGLAELSLEEEVLRRERGLPVYALIGAFEKAAR